MSQSTANPALVRTQLRAVLEQSTFRDSERHSRLLEFLVESTLAGKAGGLKEFVIAGEVWGRDISFDPRIHASVRVEVSRLRTRLQRYYAAEGRFRVRRGGYAVVFETSMASASPPISESDRFEILEPLGRGGMGEIYKARDRRLGRHHGQACVPSRKGRGESRPCRLKPAPRSQSWGAPMRTPNNWDNNNCRYTIPNDLTILNG